MTTQTLHQAISLRRQLSLDELVNFAPQLTALVQARPRFFPDLEVQTEAMPRVRAQSDSEYAFWTTFNFGCVQALVLFSLIYFYFAR